MLHNVCFIKNSSKLSSVLLLCLLRIFMKQTLLYKVRTFSCPLVPYFCTLFWDVIMIISLLFLSSQSKKKRKERMAVDFFFCEITQPFFNLNLPQNEFHSLKTEKNHNKISSQNIVTSSENNVQKWRTRGHEKVYNTVKKVGFCKLLGPIVLKVGLQPFSSDP